MPRYDYRCPRCGLEFELTRSFSQATEPALCPNDGTAAERVFRMPMAFVPGATSAGSPKPKGVAGHDSTPD